MKVMMMMMIALAAAAADPFRRNRPHRRRLGPVRGARLITERQRKRPPGVAAPSRAGAGSADGPPLRTLPPPPWRAQGARWGRRRPRGGEKTVTTATATATAWVGAGIAPVQQHCHSANNNHSKEKPLQCRRTTTTVRSRTSTSSSSLFLLLPRRQRGYGGGGGGGGGWYSSHSAGIAVEHRPNCARVCVLGQAEEEGPKEND